MLPIIKRDIVDRGWIPEEEFSDYIAVAQVAPGMIAINIATLVGMHLRKRLGALVAVIGVALPSLIVITLIASLLRIYHNQADSSNLINNIIKIAPKIPFFIGQTRAWPLLTECTPPPPKKPNIRMKKTFILLGMAL